MAIKVLINRAERTHYITIQNTGNKKDKMGYIPINAPSMTCKEIARIIIETFKSLEMERKAEVEGL